MMTKEDMQKLSEQKAKNGEFFFPTITMEKRNEVSENEPHCSNTSVLYDFDKTKHKFCDDIEVSPLKSCDFMFFRNNGKMIFIEVSSANIKSRKLQSRLTKKRADSMCILEKIAKKCNIEYSEKDIRIFFLYVRKAESTMLVSFAPEERTKLETIMKNSSYNGYLFCEDVDRLLKNKFLPQEERIPN